MAVLAEALSVVVRIDALRRAFADIEAFAGTVPNNSLCADGELARVGFLMATDVREYVRAMKAYGLVFLHDGQAKDLAVIDQRNGPTTPCAWLEFGPTPCGGEPGRLVSACRLKGGSGLRLVTPEHWQYEGSLSESYEIVPAVGGEKAVELLDRRGYIGAYSGRLSSTTMYIGRTGRENAEQQ